MRDGGCVRNACVEAACIAVGVAQAFGFLCEPIPVAVQVIAGGEATILPGDGSRRRPGFAGHLLVHYPGADTAVDLTADQFHAPDRGLLVPEPLVLPVPRDAFVGGIGFTLPTGTRMTYRELVDDVSWRALPAWHESSALTVAAIVRRMRAELADAPASVSCRRRPRQRGNFRS